MLMVLYFTINDFYKRQYKSNNVILAMSVAILKISFLSKPTLLTINPFLKSRYQPAKSYIRKWMNFLLIIYICMNELYEMSVWQVPRKLLARFGTKSRNIGLIRFPLIRIASLKTRWRDGWLNTLFLRHTWRACSCYRGIYR